MDFAARRRRLLLSRLAFSGAAAALVGMLVWLLLGMKRQVPLIAGVVSSYRAPLGPPTLAEEDRMVLGSLTRAGSLSSPGTARTIDVSARLREADRQQFLEVLVREVAALRGGGPGSDAAIIYLSAHGAVDRRGKACLLPPRTAVGTVTDVDESWLPVGELLDRCAAARKRGLRLLFVLDACRPTQGEPLGILDGTFAAAVDAELRSRPPEGIWVMLPCTAGEVATAAAPEPASTFAAAFADGLEGMADARPWGDGDGRVGLRELAGYLADEVDRRAIVHHGRHQAPLLLPTWPTAGRDVNIAWTVRATRRTSPATSTTARDAEQVAWLQRRWTTAERLRPRAVQERPTAWAAYERSLVRAERLGVAGSGGREDLRQAKVEVEALEQALSEPLVGIDLLPSLRLARQARERRAEATPAWRARLEDWIRSVSGSPATMPTGESAPAAVELATSPHEWYARAADAWAAAVQQVRSGVAPDRSAWTAWRQLVGDPPADIPLPAELQPFDVLARWADDEGWRTNAATFSRVIALAEAAAEAALPDDVRADRLVAVTAARRDADAARRQAFDTALVGDPFALARAAESARTAEAGYSAAAKLGAELSAAWRLLDAARAELPWLAAWQTAARRAAHGAAAVPNAAAIDWSRLLAAVSAMDRALHSSAESGESGAAVDLIRNAAREVVQRYETVRDAHDVACERLAEQSAEDATTLAEIRGLLDTPLVTGGLRMRLLDREATLAARIAQRPVEAVGTPQTPSAADPSAASSAWVAWNGGWIDPLVACLSRSDEAGVPRPQTTADVATAAGAWGQRLRAGAAETSASRSDPPAQRRLAFLAPSGAPGTAAEDGSAVAGQLRRAWRDRLVTVANDQMDDFFAADAGMPWCAAAAAACLRQAELLAAADAAFEKAVVRQEAMARLSTGWARIDNLPDRLGAGDGGSAGRIKTVLRIDDSVARFLPVGDAAVWLADSSGSEPLWLRGAGSDVAIRRLALPVGRADVGGGPRGAEWRVDGKSAGQVAARQGSSLDVTAVFRGHPVVGGIPVVAPGGTETIVFRPPAPVAPRITVRGGRERHGFVSFVFDCSGSMDKDTPGGRRRFDVGRQAFVEILKAMAESGNWDASVWLYGHRTRWDAATKPAQPAFSPAGLRQQAAARQAGRPFDLRPGEDVEQVLAMQPLGRGQSRTIGDVLNGLQPAGETPLYLAMQKALAGDATAVAAGEAWRVIVITDGVNDQYQGPFTTAAQVRDTLQSVGRGRAGRVPIDVIALDLRPKPGEQAAFDELKTLVRDTGGQFRDAADLSKLMESLRDFLQLARWELVDGRGTARPAEVGASLTVEPPGRAEPPIPYSVRLEGRPQTAARIAVAGGESLELFVSADGSRLEHRRYDGGTEQGIRAKQEDLTDPADPQQRWFVAAHLPKREGGAGVRFPISIQNADETRFSPRPVEVWAEVRPEGIAGVQPFVFVDAAFEPNRPVPVIDLTVPNWPKDAGSAQIGLWFSTRPLEPAGSIAVDELRFGEPQEFRWPRLAGVAIEASLEKAGPDRARLTVTERHAAGAEGGLPRLRIRLEPACERAEHAVDPAAGAVRHNFDLVLEQGRVPKGTRLTVVDRDRLKEQAAGPAVVGGRIELLRVPLPRD